ncbi:sugar-binding transcriptional regulator [Pukyongiella litopenaei]|nr:sugar-binding transcriptional regulator [Pukyongiella litopenaei]
MGGGQRRVSDDGVTPSGRLPPGDAIVEAAWCYYRCGMNQQDIARRLGVSRASVVNYLSEARRRGYVRVTLEPEIFRTHELARDLVDRFGLADALVVPPDMAEPGRSLERVTVAAGEWLPRLLGPGDRLGVAWGETVYRIAEAAPRVALADLTVVQLVGSRPAALGFAAETCSATLARRFDAHCVNLHVPLLLSDRDLADRLRNEPVIAEQLRAVAGCNKVLFACGTCHSGSHVVRTGLIDADSLAQEVATRGAAGVICGRLIDGDGNPVVTESEERMIGVSLDEMRGKDMALLVGSGANRVRPMLAAIRGGYATHVATCADTARRLLAGTGARG